MVEAKSINRIEDFNSNDTFSNYIPTNELFFELKNKYHVSNEYIENIKKVIETYPMKISRYYWNLVKEFNDPLWKQCIPDIKEIQDQIGEEGPLAEERDSPAPLITHRYPDRVLFLISETCEMYCRFCTRKRKVGTEKLKITYKKIDMAVDYIKKHIEVRDVILSGGDALSIPQSRLKYVLNKLRNIEHVEIIRLGSRIPCTNPEKITQDLCNMLKEFHPLYINVHFEHPNEITEKSKKACEMLANAGIPLGNQNVLLKGINDNIQTMSKLYKELLKIRVKPYYLFQADYVKGTDHFRTTVEKGIEIIHGIRGYISGLAIPHFVIDAPNGGGKIPIIPEYLKQINNDKVIMENYAGKTCEYEQPK